MGLFKNLFKSDGKSKSSKQQQQVTRPVEGVDSAANSPFITRVITPQSLRPVSLAGESTTPVPQTASIPATPHESGVTSKEIFFRLGEFADKIPSGLLKPGKLDLNRLIAFQATDLFANLSKGRASVSIAKLAELAPDLFEDPSSLLGQETSITLPLQRLVEQMGELRTRTDQFAEETPVRTFETPFLKAAMEDGGRPPIAPPVQLPSSIPATPVVPPAAHAAPIAFGVPAMESTIPKSTPTIRTVGGPAPQIPIPKSATPVIPLGMRPPPATVRASVTGGKIKIGGKTNSIPPTTPPPYTIRVQHTEESGAALPRTIPMPGARPVASDEQEAPIPRSIPLPTGTSGSTSVKLPSSLPVIGGDGASSIPMETAVSDTPLGASTVLAGNLSLKLKNVLQALPTVLLSGDSDSVDPSVAIQFPIALIQPQIRSGKVIVPLNTLLTALPEAYRGLITTSGSITEVPLPLRDVISGLPTEVLQYRPDQVQEEVREEIRTPFSDKAKEDAARFEEAPKEKLPTTDTVPEVPPAEIADHSAEAVAAPTSEVEAIPQPVLPKVPPTFKTPVPIIPAESKPTAVPEETMEVPTPQSASILQAPTVSVPTEKSAAPSLHTPSLSQQEEVSAQSEQENVSGHITVSTVLQDMFMTDTVLDARSIAQHAAKIPNIQSVVICATDGLSLASSGKINSEEIDSLSAIAPLFYQRVSGYTNELKIGSLLSFTIETDTGFISFFEQGTICVAVHHNNRELAPGVRTRFRTITTELHRMYGKN